MLEDSLAADLHSVGVLHSKVDERTNLRRQNSFPLVDDVNRKLGAFQRGKMRTSRPEATSSRTSQSGKTEIPSATQLAAGIPVRRFGI